jgi:hypothetical protein
MAGGSPVRHWDPTILAAWLAVIGALVAGFWRVMRAVLKVDRTLQSVAGLPEQVTALSTRVAALSGEVRGWRDAAATLVDLERPASHPTGVRR